MIPATGRRSPRLMLLITGAFADMGGLESYNRLLIRAMRDYCAERDGHVRVLSLNDGDAPEELASSALTFRGFRRNKPRFVLDAIRQARRFRPDGIVIGHLHLAPLGRSLRVLSSSWQWYILFGIEAWRRLGIVGRDAVRRAEGLIAISDYTRREFERHNEIPPDRVSLLPCAVDPAFWPHQKPENGHGTQSERLDLLTVARLRASERYKGVDETLRAVAALRSHPITYTIIGDGDDRVRLQALSTELGIADRVTFRGWVSPDALADAYREASLLVLPSAGEGFGIVYVEAALMGRPAIAGNQGGAPEVVLHGVTGWTIQCGQPEPLATLLESLLRRPHDIRRLGAAARERAMRVHTSEAFRHRLYQLLDSRLSPPPKSVTVL